MSANPRYRPLGDVPELLLGCALIAAGAVLLAFSWELTYFQDTWSFLMNRRELTVDALLEPHNEHIVLLPAAIQLLLVHSFGMDSARPDYLLLIAALLATAILVFVYVRRRIGPWPALIAAGVLLFFGPAWQDLLWTFELSFVGSVLFGVAMLLVLERGDRLGDALACAFLATSIAFSSLGVAFGAGAAVDVWQRRGRGGLGRAWIVLVPALLFAVWWLGWGQDAPRRISFTNLLSAPTYLAEGLATICESLLGLTRSTVDAPVPPEWGVAILVAVIAAVVYAQVRRPGFATSLWPIAASAGAYWFLSALNYIPGREPYQSRYLYAGGVFVLLVSAELLKGTRIGRRAAIAAGAIAILAIGSNLVMLRDGRDWLKRETVLTRADLGAIEIARETVDPSFRLIPEIAGTPSLIDIRADEYLAAAREHGSPAYSPFELAGADEAGRRQADIVLAEALAISIETVPGARGHLEGECATLAPEGPAEVPIGAGVTRIEVGRGPHASFALRRFATDGYPVTTAGARGNTTTRLEVPADRVERPWYLRVEASQGARVCD